MLSHISPKPLLKYELNVSGFVVVVLFVFVCFFLVVLRIQEKGK